MLFTCHVKTTNTVRLFSGIFFTQEETWHEQRRFLLRHLRDYGFGRRFDELEVEINDEILQFFDLIKNGSKYDFEKVINLVTFALCVIV